MHYDMSASGRATMNGWFHIPCMLSTLPGWPLWAVSGQCKLIVSNSGLSKVSVIDNCSLWTIVCKGRFYCLYIYIIYVYNYLYMYVRTYINNI